MADKLASEGLKAAADTTKQIITLSTGVIALTVTFLEKIVQPSDVVGSRSVPWTIFAAWIFFGLAIIGGTATLGAISGTLDAMDRKQNDLATTPNQDEAINALACGSNIRIPARAMSVLFLGGMAFTIATGFLMLR
jgi:hypothetical protein